jgi:metal-responsive CopG/Arc/MetJ family transcriptional regulator
MAASVATRSISISLDERLLHDLDQELSQGTPAARQNRSAALAEAIELWLQQRHLHHLNKAYADLATLEGGDLEAACQAATSMGTDALASLDA